jgi:hypothetical protein
MLFVGVAFEWFPAIKELNIGVAMKGPGSRGGNARPCGLIAMEMAGFDSSIATFLVYTMASQWAPSILAGQRYKSTNGSGRWQGKTWLRVKER